jgi:hypothetical protein
VAGQWTTARARRSNYRVVFVPDCPPSNSTLAQPSTMRSIRVIDSAARQCWESADKGISRAAVADEARPGARSTGSAVNAASWWSLTRALGVSGSAATTPIGPASCSYLRRRALPHRRASPTTRPSRRRSVSGGSTARSAAATSERTSSVSRQDGRGAAGRSGTRRSPSG